MDSSHGSNADEAKRKWNGDMVAGENEAVLNPLPRFNSESEKQFIRCRQYPISLHGATVKFNGLQTDTEFHP
jgi:hypothetical protein